MTISCVPDGQRSVYTAKQWSVQWKPVAELLASLNRFFISDHLRRDHLGTPLKALWGSFATAILPRYRPISTAARPFEGSKQEQKRRGFAALSPRRACRAKTAR